MELFLCSHMSLNGACLCTATTSPLVLNVTRFDLRERFSNTDMHCLVMGVCSEKCVLGNFVVGRTCTCMNLDSAA